MSAEKRGGAERGPEESGTRGVAKVSNTMVNSRNSSAARAKSDEGGGSATILMTNGSSEATGGNRSMSGLSRRSNEFNESG
jgi:hypothetical protein